MLRYSTLKFFRVDYLFIIVLFTGASFLVYGINSLASKRMKKEFKRWGLEKSRKIIAYCQLACGAGLLFGLELNILLIYSSIFLVIMMAVAVGVRVRSKDDISDVLPAIAYLVLGAIILYDATAHPPE